MSDDASLLGGESPLLLPSPLAYDSSSEDSAEDEHKEQQEAADGAEHWDDNNRLQRRQPDSNKKTETQYKLINGQKRDKKATYGEFQAEMDTFNRAFAEVMIEGDAKGRVFTFPIPTYNITKDFDWDNPNLETVWQMTGKYGIPYFSNFVNSDMSPDDARSMCCRLRLDNRELWKRGGGLFGANPLTGSIGVVTINLPRIGYRADDETKFFDMLNRQVSLARDSLVELDAEVPEDELAGIALDDKATVSLPSGDSAEGTVRLVSPRIDPLTKLGRVRVSLAPHPQLRVGGYARAVFNRTGKPVAAIEEKAVQWEASGPRLITIDANNLAHPVLVRTGVRDAGFVALEQGPPVGTRVALGSGVALLEGDRVNPVEPGQAAAAQEQAQ